MNLCSLIADAKMGEVFLIKNQYKFLIKENFPLLDGREAKGTAS